MDGKLSPGAASTSGAERLGKGGHDQGARLAGAPAGIEHPRGRWPQSGNEAFLRRHPLICVIGQGASAEKALALDLR